MKKNLLVSIALLALSTLQASAGYVRPDQHYQPFAAFAGLELSGQDYYFTKGGVSQKIGEEKYTYDEYGNQIGSVTTITNVDGILWQMGMFNESILPLNAVYVSEYYNDENCYESNDYYLDSQNQRHDIRIYKRIFFEDETVFLECRELDKDGNLTENYDYGKVESEFDTQNRPVYVINYYTNNGTSPLTGKDTIVLVPSSKVEFEYPAEGLITKIRSSLRTSATGVKTWEYNSKVTEGTIGDGEEYYERCYFDRYDTAWVGSDKYSTLNVQTENGREFTQKRWSWDYETKSWELSSKDITLFDSRNRVLSSDNYTYVDSISTFFLVQQNGNDYSGDTLCAEWYIYYNTPDTTVVTNQLELATYGYKTEFKDYTEQEMELPEERYYSYPRKYEISYELNLDDTSEVNWIPVEKKEFEYDTRFASEYEGPRNLATKIYDWSESGWQLNGGERFEYNDQGDRTLEESTRNGKVVDRRVNLYDYREAYYDYGDGIDTVMERFTLREERWQTINDSLVCTDYREYGYDEDNHMTLQVELNGWNSYFKTWSYGSKRENAYDENGIDTMDVSYYWYSEKKVWAGDNKTIRVGNANHDETGTGKEMTYYGRIDDDGNSVWVPQRFVFWNDSVDADGSRTYTSEQFNYWDISTNSWGEGYKRETSYNPDGMKTRDRAAYMDMETGEWLDYYHDQHIAYDSEGRVIEDSDDGFKAVYTYLPTGEVKDTYNYNMDEGGNWYLHEKSIATVVDGYITEYNDSLFGWYDYDNDIMMNSWIQTTKTVFTIDRATGKVDGLETSWDRNLKQWVNCTKETAILDSLHRPVYYEAYYWQTDYNGGGYWEGETKFEKNFDAYGNEIMEATYYWSSYDSVWVGDNKNEEEFDPVTGETTMRAEYYWNSEKQDWCGGYKYEQQRDTTGNILLYAQYDWDYENWMWTGSRKEEHEYNAEGKQMMSAYYNSTDSLGNWIGDYKNVSYNEDNINYYEYYSWSNQKNDWRGENKSESCYDNDNKYRMNADYEWDEEDWCWVGEEKQERTWTDNSTTDINYKWDKATADWVKTSKTIQESQDVDEYNAKTINTVAIWSDGQWKNASRITQASCWRSDWNIDYQLITLEAYVGSAWVESFTVKLAYIYTPLTGVEEIAADVASDLNISIGDGSITVSADDDSLIRVLSTSGANVAAGRGSVSASVVPGIYLINAGGKTIKVLVR